MPTSKTIYESFDGKEFDNEEEAKAHEEKVRKYGVHLRNKFLDDRLDIKRYIEPKIMEIIKNYPDDEAWRIMRSLKAAQHQMQHNERGLPSEGYLYYFDDDDDEFI